MPSTRPPKRRRDAPKPIATGPNSEELFTTAPPPPRKKAKTDEFEEEQDYERLPRKAKDHKKNNRLPIRTSEGWSQQATNGVEDVESLLSGGSSDEKEAEEEEGEQVNGHDKGPQIPAKEQILNAKEELAKLAARVNEDPEEHIGALRAMNELSYSRIVTVKQLAMATQCSVYKDIIPGYRIRPLADGDMTDKVSKDVRKLRAYEQSLVSGYKAYVQLLSKMSRSRRAQGKDGSMLASTALSCASTLLLAVPHFNFRPDLLKIVIDSLSRRATGKDYENSVQTIEKLFREDEDGKASLEAVQMLTKMMKTRDYQIHESILNMFLHLRLLSEFGRKGSYNRVDRTERDQIQVPKKIKRMQEKRTFHTKRNRKMTKERKILEKEMEEADAVVSHEERDKIQAEMLKLVFVSYFRILKAKTQHLMGAVLEGLAKYAHLINQDFFADILEALKELIRASNAEEDDDSDDEDALDREETVRDGTRESLLCIVTAFALLQGQEGKAAIQNLHLDLSFFITHLYRVILPSVTDANIERSSKSLHLPDPLGDNAGNMRTNVNVKTKTVLLIRCLSSVLLPAVNIRSVPPLRVAAFTKQLMTASLQLPEKSCQAMLGLLAQTSKSHGKKIAGLWRTEERRGDGVFDAMRGDVEGSNPYAASIWEGELLRLHFSPKVKEALKIIEANIRTEGGS
jgi:nucleolar complex protein 3